ncbi:ATP-binding protein [Streptacidiphilus sp. N1-3]|uniref:histidine kinase n=1 Tax=Streptacidiphilus alkalitolerans TaxID=3342712 RepID=A0ABV6XBY4_9ACTN
MPVPEQAAESRPTAGEAAPATGPARSGPLGQGRWSTRQWLTAGVSAALVVLVVLSGLAVAFFRHSAAVSNQLVDRSSPALIQAVRLEAALVNQETGTRGYALTGQAEFLEPYTQGLSQQAAATTALHALTTGDRTDAADLDLVLARAARWQRDTARPIAARPPGTPAPSGLAGAEQGKAEFDSLRAALTTQQTHLQQARNASRADLMTARRLRNWLFSTIAAVIIALAVLVFVGLRRGVNAPLERLTAQVRTVAGGDFTHPITASGPADLRRLARDVEAMRERLAHELATSQTARDAVDAYAADLARSNAELEQFAYVASHDLQEPLRKVASFCQLLQRRYAAQLDERADQYISYAVDGANRMQTLINDLLAFSRVGRVHDQYAPVDLEQVWDQTLDALSVSTTETGTELRHDPLPQVSGDRTQLGLLLQNLISNAVKFRAPDRAPRIRLTVEPDGAMWRFAFTDNGIGIDPEFADRVFIIFQRLHTRDAYPGNGIGLAMCKKIVEFHGGTITVDPHHTDGTRILFTLPQTPPPPHIPAQAEES